jgi:protein-tyrosine-phosphatase
MAEGIFNYLTKNRPEFTCESAGMAALDGMPPSRNAQIIAAKYDVDISKIRSKLITEEIMQKADYVFVMTRQHYMVLRGDYSKYADKVFILKDFANTAEHTFDPDLRDPIGQDLNAYEECFFDLDKAIRGILEKI